MKSDNLPFKIIKEDNGDTATIYLYGIIGQTDWWDGEKDITDTAFLKAMKDFEKAGKKRCDIRINSYGGSMFHMDAIIAQIQSSSMEVHTWVDGLAASAAFDIWLCAPKARRHIAKNGKAMCHAPSTYAYGTAKDLRDTADMLDVFEAGAIAQMASDTGMSEEEVKSKYFDGSDHWFSAKQCVDTGFVTSVEDYEAQKMPEDPEKMSHADLLKFYEPTKEANEPSWLGKLIAAVTPQKVAAEPVLPVKIDEVMNIEQFKNSFGKEITEDEIVKFLNEKGFEVTKKAPVDMADLVSKAVTAAVKPLNDKIEALEKMLDKTPGEGITLPKAEGDPTMEAPVEKSKDELEAEENFKAALKSQRR